MRSRCLFFIESLLLVVLLFSCGAKEQVKPNVLIIQADDLGYDDIHLHGNNIIETPALDKLGNQSIRFNQFYLSSVCAPTRASLLTGRNFLRTGVSGVHAGRDYVNLDETIIAEVFKNNGYSTGMWGKWHSGKADGYFPWDRGFDEAYYACLYNYFDNSGLLNGKEVNTEGFTTDAITDMAISFVERNKDKPFFAYMSHLAPHNPWRAPKEYIEKYKSKGLSDPMATLYGMIDNLDYNIGRLLKAVEDNGLAENTIVVFLSDNGPWVRSYRFGLNDEEWQMRNVNGLRGMKGKNWENGIRSPLFIRWTNQFEPQTVDVSTKVEDLFPTLCDIAGINIPEHIQLNGQVLVDKEANILVKDEPIFVAHYTPSGNDSYYSEKDPHGNAVPFTKEYINTFDFENQKLAIRKGAYKYIQDGKNKWLFDLVSNPKEKDELITENNEQLQVMKTELKDWYNEVKEVDKPFTMPVFQIGYNKKTTSFIYACAPQRISKSLINKEHFLANWGVVEDSAIYNIKVHTEGEYEVYLVHKIDGYENLKFQVSTLSNQTQAFLKDKGDRNFGTLIEGESAYWENFDLKETFKKGIIKSSLGNIHLSQNDNAFKLSLVDVKGDSLNKWENQVIAITLKRK